MGGGVGGEVVREKNGTTWRTEWSPPGQSAMTPGEAEVAATGFVTQCVIPRQGTAPQSVQSAVAQP